MSYPPVSPGEPPASDQPPYAPQPPYSDPLAAPPPAYPPPQPPTTYSPPEPPTTYSPPEPPTTIQPTQPPSYSPPPPPYVPGPSQPPYPPGYPSSAPPYGQPPTSYPPGAGVAPPPKKSNKTLFIVLGIVGALLLLCCVGGVGFVVYRANEVRDTIETGPGPGEPFNPGEPSQRGQNGANFNLAVGKTATITDEDGSFTLTLTSAKWNTANCDSNSFFPPPDGKILVLDVTFEVKSGVASINPLFFDFRDSAGRTADISFFSGCDEPNLDSGNNLRAGTKRSGKFAFDVIGGQTGTLEYQNSFEPAASWKITA
jgi:Domain of unknown function (DUF4352)